ncbi:hypothetical protein ACJRO7_034923 [Eucalyptus globulus]|uniref:Uncharacterized protein n=1 Tax=Eucalyptus globulus TaxID=34317 RepID=A0ABD3J7U8_EUCGL
MGIRLRGSLQAKKLFSQTIVTFRKAASAPPNVPKGFFRVHVGETRNDPSCWHVLSRSKEEYGFDYPTGGLTDPREEETFVTITSCLTWT